MMLEAGFVDVSHENLTGGIVALHSGFKLEE
jgi:ubiquinone/menaquinone biosynthesis C-methylase UbiE